MYLSFFVFWPGSPFFGLILICARVFLVKEGINRGLVLELRSDRMEKILDRTSSVNVWGAGFVFAFGLTNFQLFTLGFFSFNITGLIALQDI